MHVDFDVDRPGPRERRHRLRRFAEECVRALRFGVDDEPSGLGPYGQAPGRGCCQLLIML